jgi:hypothetical protein
VVEETLRTSESPIGAEVVVVVVVEVVVEGTGIGIEKTPMSMQLG